MQNLRNILNSVKKTLGIIFLISILLVIPLTVFVAQQQQNLKQKAASGNVDLFFTKEDGNKITNLDLKPGEQATLVLNLDTKGNPVNGFDVTAKVNGLNYLSISSNPVSEGKKASGDFTTSGRSLTFERTSGNISFAKIIIDTINPSRYVTGIIDLFSFTFTVQANASGQAGLEITDAQITSPGSTDSLAVNNSNLSLNISTSGVSNPAVGGSGGTPTQTPSPVPSGPCLATETQTDFGCVPNDPIGFVKKFYSIGLGLIGGVSLLFIIYGGYLMMTSSGNPEQLAKGKSRILYAVVGLLLGIFGYIFVQILAGEILRIPGFGS